MHQETKKTLTFIGIAFFFSWLLIGVYTAFGGEAGSRGASVILFLGMLIPGISAVYVQKFLYKEPLKKPFALYFKPNSWFFVAWIIPVIIIFATNEVGLELPWHEYSSEMEGFYEKLSETQSPEQVEQFKSAMDIMPIPFFWILFIQGLIAGITIMLLFSLCSEIGWRGFLQNQFSHVGFWKSSAMIGLIWGVWSAPVILTGHIYRDNPLAGLGMMVMYCLLLSPLVSYMRLKARSVVASAIFLGTLTGLAGIPLVYVKGGSDFTAGINGLAGFIVLAAANILLFIYERFLADTPVIPLDNNEVNDIVT